MGETRTLVEKSWLAACRRANELGAIAGNGASSAGQYLAIAANDPQRAIGMLPADGGAFWAHVRELLTKVDEEDRAERGPRINRGRTGT